MVAAIAATLGSHLFVGEHGAERGAPVDECLVEVGEPVRVDDRPAGVAVELTPGPRVGVGLALRVPAALLELLEELGDGPGPFLAVVVPGAVQLRLDRNDAGKRAPSDGELANGEGRRGSRVLMISFLPESRR